MFALLQSSAQRALILLCVDGDSKENLIQSEMGSVSCETCLEVRWVSHGFRQNKQSVTCKELTSEQHAIHDRVMHHHDK